MTFQHGWASCPKCQGLHYAGFPDFTGVCPAGGQHEQTGSFAYEVEYDVAQRSNLQHGWAACPKCQGLHYAGFPNFAGVCPAGGQHEQTGSFAYALPYDLPASPATQSEWAACPKCQGFFYGPFGGACPAGGSHSRENSWAYHAPCAAISNFTFHADISQADRIRLTDLHRWGFTQLGKCSSLDTGERAAMFATYRKAISHGFEPDADANASAVVGGSNVDVNFTNFATIGNREAAQSLIHELAHCAGFDHPDRKDPAPGQPRDCAQHDCPGDGGLYYGSVPLRAELCIAGKQSDATTCSVGPDQQSQVLRLAPLHRLTTERPHRLTQERPTDLRMNRPFNL